MVANPPTVQLWIDGGWVDVTNYVRNQYQANITRYSGWQAQDTSVQPARCGFVLNNFGDPGPWSYQTPGALYYGKIGVGTECRILKGAGVRFHGELSSLRHGTDMSNRDAWLEIAASGALGRRSIGSKLVRSPLYMSSLHPFSGGAPVAYWSLEDGVGATRAASGVQALKPAVVNGNFGFEADADLAGSAPLPSPLPASRLTATIPASAYPAGFDTATDGWAVFFVAKIPVEPAADYPLLTWMATGTVVRYQVVVTTAGLLDIRGFTSAGTDVIAAAGIDLTTPSASSLTTFLGEWLTVLVSTLDGTDVTMQIAAVGYDSTEATTGGALGAGAAGPPVGALTVLGASEDSPFSIGHWSTFASWAEFPDPRAPSGWVGEAGSERVSRACGENGVASSLRGTHIFGTGLLGPQPRGTLPAVLQDAAEADGGMLFDARDSLAVGYVNRLSLYNQLPTLELDITSGHLHEIPDPADDSVLARNDVTVSRPSGSSGRKVIADGDPYHQTTEDPPLGIGVFDSSLSINVETDNQCDDQAGWYAHVGSTKDPRYGQVVVKLHAPVFADDPDLTAAALAVDIGRTLTLTGQPSWCPPGLVELMVHGYAEVMDRDIHEIRWRTAPARPWEVWILDSGGSTSVHAVNSSATTLRLATSLGPNWSITNEPYHVSVDGEAMTVTAMTTDTPAFIAAGAADHDDNASLTPGLPAGMTPDVGQLMLLLAAIRNSGTGTVNVPTGWASLVEFGNVRLMYRYYVTGDAGPTVTFTGGAAGATTSAQIAAFSGLSHELGSGTKAAPAAATVLNGSAANITTPAAAVWRDGGVKLWIGWRAQDWTSVATLAAADAEIGEPDSGLGDNQGLVWDYDIYTTAADVAADAFVVTGGVNGISRGITLALRPLQTATVTRSVNGVSMSHAAGDAVHAWRLGAIAL